MAAQTIHRLKHPVAIQFRQAGGDIRDESITEIKLRRPTGKEMKLIDLYPGRRIHMLHAMIASLSGLDEDVVDRCDAEDLLVLYELVGGFLDDGLMTGATG